MASRPFRPPLAFRVGVTGARDMPPAAVAAIEAAIADVLDEVCRICADVAGTAAARAVYGSAGPDERAEAVAIHRTMISPLARGSDQLVARAALARGYALHVPMPFPLAVYEQDFGPDLPVFHELLAKAQGRILEMDGERAGDAEWRSYEAVGRLVARNCDLLVAIWDDGTPPKGRGGTRDTISFALDGGIPVWWIHAAGKRRPVLLAHPSELADPRPDGAGYALGELVKAHLLPPLPPPPARADGILQGLRLVARGLCVAVGREPSAPGDPLQTFLAEEESALLGRWLLHKRVIRALTKGSAAYAGVETRLGGYWWTAYAAPDRLSGAYAMRYRSTYVYVILLAAAALLAASLASWSDAYRWTAVTGAMGVAEFASLLSLLFVIDVAQRERWHDRWIAYRLLAELCRKQSALALLGWSLPILQARTAVASEPEGGAWVGWYYAALSRAAPLATGSLASEPLAEIRRQIADLLVSDQIGYHRHRAAESALASRRLLKWGERCFFATLLLVAIKAVAFFVWGSSPRLGFFAAALPTIAASVFALRSYAELDVLANQSDRMANQIEVMRERVAAAGVTGPLASQALGHDLARLIAVMLSDVTGWAQLFRMKGIEIG